MSPVTALSSADVATTSINSSKSTPTAPQIHVQETALEILLRRCFPEAATQLINSYWTSSVIYTPKGGVIMNDEQMVAESAAHRFNAEESSPAPGSRSFYRAFRILGSHPAVKQAESWATWHDEHTRHAQYMDDARNALKSLDAVLSKIPKDPFSTTLARENVERYWNTLSSEEQALAPAILRDFINAEGAHTYDLSVYIDHVAATRPFAMNIAFLDRMRIPAITTGIYAENWVALAGFQDRLEGAVEQFIRNELAKAYGLAPLENTENHSSTDLLELLRIHGPLVVEGPFKRKGLLSGTASAATHPFHGYQLSAERTPLDFTSHEMGVVVGATCDTAGTVSAYYIDPMEIHTPNAPQRVYCFPCCFSISTLFGLANSSIRTVTAALKTLQLTSPQA